MNKPDTTDDEVFPLKPKKDKIRADMEFERTADDLSKEELDLFRRLYPFTPMLSLQKRFGINSKVYQDVRNILQSGGELLRKNEDYSLAVSTSNHDPAKKQIEKQTPGFFLSSFLDTVNEEERRELLLMAEEGVDPVQMMEYLITFQSKRVIKGWEMEKDGKALHKTTNEAVETMTQMVDKLYQMKEGQRTIHGLDDSFVSLLLALNQNKEEVEEDWMLEDAGT